MAAPPIPTAPEAGRKAAVIREVAEVAVMRAREVATRAAVQAAVQAVIPEAIQAATQAATQAVIPAVIPAGKREVMLPAALAMAVPKAVSADLVAALRAALAIAVPKATSAAVASALPVASVAAA
jgi:hypothetical protein